MIPKQVEDWLIESGHGKISAARIVSGGCINDGRILTTTSGGSFFLKTNTRAKPEMFAREAAGLEALSKPEGPSVPKSYLFGQSFLLMEDLDPGQRSATYWPEFGQRLAALHLYTAPRFGFDHDNFIGSTDQLNSWIADGHQFFGEQRLLFQANLANQRGLLDLADVRRVQKLTADLPVLVPDQPASLIHGDLWGGNAITDALGNPALIDPATHYGWAEAELAMTALFSTFPDVFYKAYEEVRPLEKSYWDRFPIYNLYHLLNHLNLFGRGYLAQVQSILKRYT